MTRELEFKLVDLTKSRKIDLLPDCRESYTSFAESEGGWLVTVPATVDINEAHTATWAPNPSESQGFASSCWEVGPAEPPQSFRDEWWHDHQGAGNACLSDHDICKNLIGMDETTSAEAVERMKRQKLEELKVQVMAQNPSYLGVPAPQEDRSQAWNDAVEEKLYGQGVPARKGLGERLEREGYGKSTLVGEVRKAWNSLELMRDAMAAYHESRAPEEPLVEYVCPISGMVHWIPKCKLERMMRADQAVVDPKAHRAYATPAPLQNVEVFSANASAANPVTPKVYGLASPSPNWEPKVREGLPKWKRREITPSLGDLVMNEMQAEEDAKFFQTLKSGYGVSVEMNDCDMSFDPGVTQEPYQFEPFPNMDISLKDAVLPGADNLGEVDDTLYFRKQLINAMCFPKAALEAN